MGTEQHLEGAFGTAAPAHYDWQTASPFVADRERELCEGAFLPLRSKLLDLGCAEGATLYHLGEPAGAVGVDIFADKLAFARQRLPSCTFLEGSAYELPFAHGSFEQVIIRDVIHHIDEPERAIREIARVLQPGGRLDILEPCRNNPLILMHALTRKEERGELRSTMRFLTGLVEAEFFVTKTQRMQPFPIHRLVFHPDLGKPAWGEHPVASGFVNAVEGLASVVMPRVLWAYLHVRAERR